MNSKKMRILRAGCFLMCIIVFAVYAWHSDDAYHAYIMAKNLVEGNGFVYNVGERVNASTCPLFTLCVAAIYFVVRNMFISGLIAGILFSGLAAYIAIYKFARTEKQVIFATFTMVCSACFVSYTTAGLENSLLYFLAALFYYIFFIHEKYTDKQLYIMGLAVGLTGITRMDAVLFFVIPVCYAYLFKRKGCSFVKCVGIGIGALSPFVLWELFSLFYYGFFIPNTAFAKLGTGIARMEYIERGINFVSVSSLYDILVIFIPIVYVGFCLAKRNLKRGLSAISLLIYFIYVLYIGGDFMVGRHLTVLYFISVMGCLDYLREFEEDVKINMFILGTVGVAILINIVIPDSYVNKFMYGGEYSKFGGGVADERAFYSPNTSLRSNLKYLFKEDELLVRKTWRENDYLQYGDVKGIVLGWAPGIVVYYDNKDIHLVDNYALGDPLLSKIPVEYVEDWRVGHTYRNIPLGYQESLATMTNQIQDESLHEYYDKLLLVVRGELFSKERLKTIIELNLGKYDYLLENYVNNCYQ